MNPKTNAVLENVIRALKRAALFESGSRVEIHADDDGGRMAGFKSIPAGADSQTYDSHLVGDNNGKTVQKLAAAALRELLKQGGSPTTSEVFDFVDEYVMKHGGKRARRVRWNSKSYPD